MRIIRIIQDYPYLVSESFETRILSPEIATTTKVHETISFVKPPFSNGLSGMLFNLLILNVFYSDFNYLFKLNQNTSIFPLLPVC